MDGLQHFKQIANWKNYEDIMKKDVYKMKQVIKNGYTIIRLLQEDVWYNKNDWSKKLTDCINTHPINNNSYYFLCAKNEYENHEKLLNDDTIDNIFDVENTEVENTEVENTEVENIEVEDLDVEDLDIEKPKEKRIIVKSKKQPVKPKNTIIRVTKTVPPNTVAKK